MSFTIIKTTCATEQGLLQLAAELAHVIRNGIIINLQGPLGAGKTTFSRGFLTALGHKGKVKSPTYTLLEQYELPDMTVNHFDLYRLIDPEELEQIGIRDYFQPGAVCLVEWPEKGVSKLPTPDIRCEIDFVEEGRAVTLAACTKRGNEILNILCNDL